MNSLQPRLVGRLVYFMGLLLLDAGCSNGRQQEAWPAQPAPAFLPRGTGCVSPYVTFQDGCAHAAFMARNPPASVETAFELYRRGAVPPKVGGPSPKAAAAPAQRKPADMPGADTAQQRAEQAKQRRLRALELMLQAANEKVAAAGHAPSARASALSSPPANPSAPAPSPAPAASASALPSSEPAPDISLLSKLRTVLGQMTQGQAATMLEKMEKQGMRSELGEDVWSQLSTKPRADGM